MSHHLPIIPILFIVVFVVGPMLFRALFGSKKRVIATTETNEANRRSNFAELQRITRQLQGSETEELAELLSLAEGGSFQNVARTLRDAASVTITTETITSVASTPESYARPTRTATVSTSHNAAALADLLKRQAEKAAAAAAPPQSRPSKHNSPPNARARARSAHVGTLVDPIASIEPLAPLPRLKAHKVRAPLAPHQPLASIAISI